MDAVVQPTLPVLPGPKTPPVVVVELLGEPRGKGRPRSRIATGRGGQQFVAVYTDKDTRSYEGMLRFVAGQAMHGRPPLDCALSVKITASFSVPQSWSGKQQRLALEGARRPLGRPDADNLNKAIIDACNKIVWVDDARIVELLIEKHYSEKPGLRMEVWITAMPGLPL
jgi:Holliday junction resolvase RusA-like endonuclease